MINSSFREEDTVCKTGREPSIGGIYSGLCSTIAVHLVHPSGETIKHGCKQCWICCVRSRGLAVESLPTLRTAALVWGFCCRSSGSQTLLGSHLP